MWYFQELHHHHSAEHFLSEMSSVYVVCIQWLHINCVSANECYGGVIFRTSHRSHQIKAHTLTHTHTNGVVYVAKTALICVLGEFVSIHWRALPGIRMLKILYLVCQPMVFPENLQEDSIIIILICSPPASSWSILPALVGRLPKLL